MVRLPKLPQSSSLKLRILSSIILIPLTLYLISLGSPVSLFLGGFVTLLVIFEWTNLCLKLKASLVPKVSFVTLGTVYLAFSLGWLIMVLAQSEGWKLLFWLFLLVWATDTGAYVVGSNLKGPKLLPSVSPNKTWSGFIGGLIFGSLVPYVASHWLVQDRFPIWGIFALVLIAQAGDLLESQAKRWCQVKDSGFLIPGHGGILDRLDSLLAVAFALALWDRLFLW